MNVLEESDAENHKLEETTENMTKLFSAIKRIESELEDKNTEPTAIEKNKLIKEKEEKTQQ